MRHAANPRDSPFLSGTSQSTTAGTGKSSKDDDEIHQVINDGRNQLIFPLVGMLTLPGTRNLFGVQDRGGPYLSGWLLSSSRYKEMKIWETKINGTDRPTGGNKALDDGFVLLLLLLKEEKVP